jgi:hypothetical protein
MASFACQDIGTMQAAASLTLVASRRCGGLDHAYVE